MVERLLRVSQAADLCGVSVSYLNQLRGRGGGPVFAKLGAAVVYDPGDLRAWVEARKKASTSTDKGPAR